MRTVGKIAPGLIEFGGSVAPACARFVARNGTAALPAVGVGQIHETGSGDEAPNGSLSGVHNSRPPFWNIRNNLHALFQWEIWCENTFSAHNVHFGKYP